MGGAQHQAIQWRLVSLLTSTMSAARRMAHCHIAEHQESGMMFSFDVTA